MTGFYGDVVAKWLVDKHRNMELVEPFKFIDPAGLEWEAPQGAIINGASIPRGLWSFGPPYVGKYRRASVIHDHYSETQERSWQATHRVFYHMCRADGVKKIKAKLMYAAVYVGGPRWLVATQNMTFMSAGGIDNITKGQAISLLPTMKAEKFDEIQSWIEDEDPSLDSIEAELEKHVTLFSAGGS